MYAGGQHLGDLGSCHDGRQGAAVADALGHAYNVGYDPLQFETPVFFAGAGKAGLHFVGNAKPARFSCMPVGLLQISIGEDYASADSLDRFGDKGGDPSRGAHLDKVLHVVGVFAARFGIVPPIGAAIWIGRHGVLHAKVVGNIELPGAVGGQAHAGCIATVVGVAQGDYVVISGVGSRHEKRQVIGFGTGI